MDAATEIRYLVRARADAPEKGPYTRSQIEQSHSKGLLKDGALVRIETAAESETMTVKELVEEKEVARAKMLNAFAQQDAEHAVQREAKGGQANMVIGGLCVVAGLAITAATFSAASESGGHYVVCTGLIVFGLFRFIRGATQR